MNDQFMEGWTASFISLAYPTIVTSGKLIYVSFTNQGKLNNGNRNANTVIPNSPSRLMRKKVSLRNQRRKGKYSIAKQREDWIM